MSAEGSHHITPLKTYYNIISILLVFTVITVAVAQVDFGIFNTFIAMFIASIKAFFVLAYFMHLKYDDKIYRAMFGVSILGLVLLWAVLLTDWSTRIPQVSPL